MSLSVFQRILTGKNRQRAEARRKRLVSAFQKRKGFSLDILEPRMLLSADALPAAVVTTDQLDYAPGETAIISAFNNGTEGVEFVAGEEVRFEVTRTRALYEKGRPLLAKLGSDLRMELTLIWLVGTTILDKIEAADYDVFTHRPAIRRRDQAVIMARAAKEWATHLDLKALKALWP